MSRPSDRVLGFTLLAAALFAATFVDAAIQRDAHEPALQRTGRLVEDLDAEIPLRRIARLDRLVEIAAVEVGIGAVDLHRLVPDHRLHAQNRLPVEFHEAGRAIRGHQPEGVDAEAFHEAEGAGNGPV